MNPLEALKELQIKPINDTRKPVAIVIKTESTKQAMSYPAPVKTQIVNPEIDEEGAVQIGNFFNIENMLPDPFEKKKC
jgi:hypothetical protein